MNSPGRAAAQPFTHSDSHDASRLSTAARAPRALFAALVKPLVAPLCGALLLAACGGGDDAPAPAPVPAPATTPAPSGIGAAGGTVTGPNGAQVVVPPNALTSNVPIAVAQSSTGAPPLPATRTAAGEVFALTPHGTTFAVPATISVPFNPASVPTGRSPALWKTNAAQTGWEEVAGATVAGGAMSAQVTRFSWVVVTYPSAVAPTITTQPANLSVTAGQTASFSVAVDGSTPFSYQWRRNGSDIAGATASTYSFAAALSDNGTRYSVVVSNAGGSITSSEATLTVNPAPVAPAITTAPASVAVTAGQPATFTVAASGTAPLAYQWRRNGADIAGATTDSFTLPTTTVADNGAQFSVRVTNIVGSVTSDPATLTVNPAPVPPAITTAPASISVSAGQPAAFSVVASGSAPLAYQWLRNGADIAGATSASYTLANATLADSGAQFSVRVSNVAGSATSPAATLTVTAATSLGVPTLLDERAFAVNPSEVRSVIDDTGNATVVWAQETGGPNFEEALYARRFNASSNAWEAERRLDLGGTGVSVATPPAVAIDQAGNVMAVWTERPGRVMAARYAASAGQWSTATPIATLSFLGTPSVALDVNGNGVILFPADDPALAGSQARMHFVRYTAASNTFAPPLQIESYAGSVIDTSSAALAVNASGNAIAVWSRADASGGINVFARYNASSNTWSTPSQYGVVSGVAGLQYDDQGNGLVLSNNGFWRFPAGGGAERTLGIATGVQLTTLNTRLAGRPDGGAVAVTMFVDGNNVYTARVRYYDRATNTWTAPADVITNLAQNANLPMVLSSARNGEAVLLVERAGLQALRLPAGSTTWGAPRLASRSGATAALVPAAAAIDITGRMTSVWTEREQTATRPIDLWGNVLAP